MGKRKPIESTWQALHDIRLVPARMPATGAAERRDLKAREALLCRVHSEFEEMPGLAVTLGQAARLFGLPPDITSRILDGLTAAQVLRLTGDGRFALHAQT